MYKNLKMLQNLDKTQIEGLTEKCKNFKNVQKIENLDKTVQKSEKMENFSKSWKFLTKLKLKKCTNC